MSKRRCDIPSEYVHVTQRGLGRRIIFEDDLDRRRLLLTIRSKLDDSGASVLSWCLMDNHFHLLVRSSAAELSRLMQRVGISYAQYFNGRHGHVGKVFQSRFSATPIESETHLLAAIRYIHRNPEEAGYDVRRYPWSSYREIAESGHEGEARLCDARRVLDLFGGMGEFVRFHEDVDEVDGFVRIDGHRGRLDDAAAEKMAVRRFGENYSDLIRSMERKDRDDALKSLKELGLSIRQIERLTGIGRGVIARA